MSTPSQPPTPAPPVTDNRFVVLAAIVGILIYGALVAYGLYLSGWAEDKHWVRVLYLLNGVEAIAFAGAGFLFGREVRREQAESAELRAKEEAGRAELLSIRAANGALLARRLRALSSRPSDESVGETPSRPASRASESSELRALRELADSLFPE